MSDLTPDGGPVEQAAIAIRPFKSKNQVVISHRECEMMLSWADQCRDPANGEVLSQLVEAFQRSN